MIYDLVASIYDQQNSELNYPAWADFFERIFEREMKTKPDLVLDLGCGTGKMTVELAKRGYDMTGIDYSPLMLDIARKAAAEAKLDSRILFLCQDMTEFELYGTVDAAVSCLDCVNHLTDTASLRKCFSLVHNYLIPDGIFLFDMNGRAKFERVYANEVYTAESDDSFCIWENDYNPKRGICDFYITLFKKDRDGRYTRFDEVQRERAYSLKTIKKTLAETGFEYIGGYRDFDFSEGDDTSDRIYIAARCIKKGIFYER